MKGQAGDRKKNHYECGEYEYFSCNWKIDRIILVVNRK